MTHDITFTLKSVFTVRFILLYFMMFIFPYFVPKILPSSSSIYRVAQKLLVARYLTCCPLCVEWILRHSVYCFSGQWTVQCYWNYVWNQDGIMIETCRANHLIEAGGTALDGCLLNDYHHVGVATFTCIRYWRHDDQFRHFFQHINKRKAYWRIKNQL